MKISSTVLKAIALSTSIFWTIIFTEDFEPTMIILVLLSLIPISLCCMLTIWATIAPFFWYKKTNINGADVFKKYFPFYAIACFALCFYGVMISNFDIYISSFFTSAFFTTMQSWTWLAKNNKE